MTLLELKMHNATVNSCREHLLHKREQIIQRLFSNHCNENGELGDYDMGCFIHYDDNEFESKFDFLNGLNDNDLDILLQEFSDLIEELKKLPLRL